MRGIFFIGLGLVLLLVVASCSRKIASSSTTEVKDSIVYKEFPRIVTVTVPGETVTVEKRINCDSLTNKPKPEEIIARDHGAKIKISIKSDGSLTATGGCDSLKKEVEAMDKELFHWKHEKQKDVKIVEVPVTRTIDKICRTWTGITVILGSAFAFYKLNRIRV